MTTEEVLIAAREKIADEKHWTQEAFARIAPDEDEGEVEGRDVRPTNSNAVCWCATGAIAAIQGVTAPDWGDVFTEAFGMTDSELESFNDTHTHTEVLNLFDQAIASEQARSAPAS